MNVKSQRLQLLASRASICRTTPILAARRGLHLLSSRSCAAEKRESQNNRCSTESKGRSIGLATVVWVRQEEVEANGWPGGSDGTACGIAS